MTSQKANFSTQRQYSCIVLYPTLGAVFLHRREIEMLDEEVGGADVVRTMISHVAEETQGLCRGAHEGHSALRQQQDLPSVTTQLYCLPSEHAGSDPEAFWFRPVMAITASVQPESGRVV